LEVIMNTYTPQGQYPSAQTPPGQPMYAGQPPAVVAGRPDFWRRLLAVNIFAASLGASIAITGGGIHYRSGGSGLQTLFFILYEALLLTYWNGQTIGKKAMGIRVVVRGGQPVPIGMAFARAGMKIVSGRRLGWYQWPPVALVRMGISSPTG